MYLGDFPVGSTIYIPFATYGKTNGESITMTGLAVTDIEIFKNGNATARASDAGVTLLDTDGTDFAGIVGAHGFSINTADNTAANFFTAGADYWVIVSSVTVDSQTVNFIAATFSIENRRTAGELIRTTIATLSSQTSFTLTAGSADNNTYVGCTAIISDIASGIQKAVGYVSAYTGSTRTVTLGADPGIFTMAAGDNITILATSRFANTHAVGGTIQTARDLGASVLISSGTGAGQLSVTSGVIAANVTQFGGAAATASGGRPEVNTSHIAGAAVSTSAAQIGVNVVNAGGTAWGSGAITSGTFATGAITAGAIAADAIGASELATDAVTEIVGGVWNAARASYAQANSFGEGVASVQGNVTGSVASVTGNVGGNVTGSVGSVASGGITAASVATGAIDADALAADAGTELATAVWASATRTLTAPDNLSIPTTAEIADKILGRNIEGGSDGGRTTSEALYPLRNKVTVSGGTMTVYKPDDSTSAWTAAVTGTAGADPITSVDPA